MKKIKIFLIILLSVSLGKAYSQSRIDYDTCSYLSEYEGEWRYTNGSDTIKVYLRKHKSVSGDPFNPNLLFIGDRLYGWHEYKQGNTIIESNYQYRFMSLPYDYDSNNWNADNFSIHLAINRPCSNRLKLYGSITDYLQPGDFHTVMININAGKTEMTWHQFRSELRAFPLYTGMTLPGNFVLIKQ